MRLLHVCETAKGGVGSYISLFAEFSPDDIVSSVVVPEPHELQIGSRLARATFPYSRRGPRAIWAMIRATGRQRRAFKPDVYFFHSTFSLFALLALRLGFDRTPALFCAHGWAVSRYGPTSVSGRLVRLIEGTLCGLADRVINISAHELSLARTLRYRGRQVVIENAVPDADPGRDDLFAQDGEALRLLFVGRLDRQKGLDLLLEALALPAAQRDDLRVHVVGESVNRDGQDRPLPACVRMHGWVPREEIDDWYRSADALIVPSRWEGFGLVVAEAFRNGTPALVSDRGGVKSLVTPGETGVIFEPDPSEIASLIGRLDRAALRAMRPACRRVYEHRFAVDRFAADFTALLDGLPASAPAAGSLAEQPR